MKPAVEWVSSPRRPSDDLPSSRAATSSGRRDLLERRAERELARVQDERLVRRHLDQPGQVGLILGRVDVGVLVVVEQPEVPVEPHVDARGLHHRGVPRVQRHPPGVDFMADVAVREQHATSLGLGMPVPPSRSPLATGTPPAESPRGSLVPWLLQHRHPRHGGSPSPPRRLREAARALRRQMVAVRRSRSRPLARQPRSVSAPTRRQHDVG